MKRGETMKRHIIFRIAVVLNVFVLSFVFLSTLNRRSPVLETTAHAGEQLQETSPKSDDVVVEKHPQLTTTAPKRKVIRCVDKSLEPTIEKRGAYWVLQNYVAANGEIHCDETITFTTHGDLGFYDNLQELVLRWMGPISMASYSPGDDFADTIKSIAYVRHCLRRSELIRRLVSFHIFFDVDYVPSAVIDSATASNRTVNCSLGPPWFNHTTYRQNQKLVYPVNVARNIARTAANTHFLFPSDIELYPSPRLIGDFIKMINDNPDLLKNNSVFVLPIFEIRANLQIPNSKSTLVEMLRKKMAIPFHKNLCPLCHKVPKATEWSNDTSDGPLRVFYTAKRRKPFNHWEPIFICTSKEPLYEERLSWEGKSDKMTQGYIMCALNYNFHILSNAFLTHKPGIKTRVKDKFRDTIVAKQNSLLKKKIKPEIFKIYGKHGECL